MHSLIHLASDRWCVRLVIYLVRKLSNFAMNFEALARNWARASMLGRFGDGAEVVDIGRDYWAFRCSKICAAIVNERRGDRSRQILIATIGCFDVSRPALR